MPNDTVATEEDKWSPVLRERIAKGIADVIGHGMREKCQTHADVVMRIVAAELRGWADCCEDCKARHGVTASTFEENMKL